MGGAGLQFERAEEEGVERVPANREAYWTLKEQDR